MAATGERPITIAMLALGGQGGGVLSNWLVDLAEANGFLAQSTYVAGVAQRTGATVYCVEMLRRAAAEAEGRPPVFAQYPVPGDVDIVIASELAETGRALEKGFVTPNITTLIASSHRDYAISEKTALGDGIMDLQPVMEAAREAAQRFICFDMAARARETSSVISAVIFGAVAGSGALPFQREQYEEVIRASGRAVGTNLAGFAAGFAGAHNHTSTTAVVEQMPLAMPKGPAGKALAVRIDGMLPAGCRNMALHGALRTLSYQDQAYADLYLERLARIESLDRSQPHASANPDLTETVARELALQMCYEDTIRVAEIKTRTDRLAGIGRDIGAASGQPWYVTEYFHPRFEEMCDTLPAGLGARAVASPAARRWTAPLFRTGRNLNTNKIWGYVLLSTLARLRRWRRGTLRYTVQQQHIEGWLAAVAETATVDYEGAVALAGSIEIVRGYGETYERGLKRYRTMLEASRRAAPGTKADLLRRLHGAALADEQGSAFEKTLSEING
ncbi:MAG TPA: indolepyruvate oxidoreductase subunit beta family protein [Woeseiaceae bacterium]|nr:indolepyruvate oxidoreductase subunit beta family protein [Woeseiaceae bacterium]